MKILTHEFVEYIPETLKDGILYVSIPFRIVSHKCCCGCGEEVVLKLSPKDWRMTFDGETISIDPSIGNWSLKCQSHYWIRNSQIHWGEKWSKSRIQRARSLKNAPTSSPAGAADARSGESESESQLEIEKASRPSILEKLKAKLKR